MNKPESVVYGDGVVTGHGMIHGRKVFVFSQVWHPWLGDNSSAVTSHVTL